MAFAVLIGLFACRAEPSADGRSLRCASDEDCEAGARCLEGICVANSPPELAIGDVVVIPPGLPNVLDAGANDLDGDPLTYDWRSTSTPALLPAPVSTGQVTVQMASEGTFGVQLSVTDGRVDVVRDLTVIVANEPPLIELPGFIRAEPSSPLVLESNARDPDGHALQLTWEQTSGPPVPLTGVNEPSVRLTTPAAGEISLRLTVDDGYDPVYLDVLVAIDAASTTLFVSGASEATLDCGTRELPCATVTAALTLDPDATVLVAANEAPYSECLRATGAARIVGGFAPDTWRYDPDRLRARTVLECDVSTGHGVGGTSTIRDLTLTVAAQTIEDGVITINLAGSSAMRDVDVIGANCGPNCGAVGAWVRPEANARLEGVNVTLTARGFESVASFIGVFVENATLTYRGASAPRTFEDEARGVVLSNATVLGLAGGIQAERAELTVENVRVSIGLGETSEAIGADASTLEVSGSAVEVFALGGFVTFGIVSEPCRTERCEGVAEFGSTMNLVDNRVRLVSPAGDSGPVPCLGVGIGAIDGVGEQRFEGNRVELVSGFAQSAGVLLADSPNGASDSSGVIDDNIIFVDGGRFDSACSVITGLPLVLPLGTLGLGAAAVSVRAHNNQIAVGGHDVFAYGAQFLDIEAADVEGNQIEVGVDTGFPARAVSALYVENTRDSAVKAFARRNRFVARAEPKVTRGIQTRGYVPWIFDSNFVYGGDGAHSTGVQLNWTPSVIAPVFVHNTIHGGGVLGTTRSSRALRSNRDEGREDFVTDETEVRWVNNLLDGGRGSGRRYGIDNAEPLAFLADQTGIQVEALSEPLTLDALLPVPTTVLNATPGLWTVLSHRASEILRLGRAGDLDEEASTAIPGASRVAFAGRTLFGPAFAALTDETVEILTAADGDVVPFTFFPIDPGLAGTVQNLWLGDVFGEFARPFPLDALLAVDDGTGGTELYVVRELVGPPVPLELAPELGAVTVRAVVRQNSGTNRFVIVDQEGNEPARLISVSSDAAPQTLSLAGIFEGPIDEAKFLTLRPQVTVNYDDLFLRSGDRFTILRDFNPNDTSGLDVNDLIAFNNETPCDRGGATALEIVRVDFLSLSPTRTQPLVFFLCADGQLEVFEDAPLNRFFVGTTFLGTDVGALAVASFATQDSIESYLLAERNGTLELWQLDPGGNATFTEVATYRPPSQGAYRELPAVFGPSPSPPPSLEPDASSVEGFLNPSPRCSLAVDTSLDVTDLHLSPAASACQSRGAPPDLQATIDIDGETRPVVPDLGADEVF